MNHFIADKLHPYYHKESYKIQIQPNVEFECGFLLERVYKEEEEEEEEEHEFYLVTHNIIRNIQ